MNEKIRADATQLQSPDRTPPERRGAAYPEPFATMFVRTFADLAKHPRSDAYWRTLAWCFDRLKPDRMGSACHSWIIEDLGLSRPSVSRAMRQLVEDGVLEKEGRGPAAQYRLNSKLVWKGSPAARLAWQNAAPECDLATPVDHRPETDEERERREYALRRARTLQLIAQEQGEEAAEEVAKSLPKSMPRAARG